MTSGLALPPCALITRVYVPWNWRAWWDFGCGAIGDMACHIMDPAFWSLKLYEAKSYTVQVMYQEDMNDQTGPNKSTIKYEFPARGDMPPVTVTWYDGTIPRIQGENPYRHWLEGIRSGEKTVSDFSYAGPLTEVANMGNVALHSGDKKLEVDVVNMRITNIPEANQLLTKEYRKGWELPV